MYSDCIITLCCSGCPVVNAMNSAWCIFLVTISRVFSSSFGITFSEKWLRHGMSYLGSNTWIIFTNPSFSSTENGLMSFAMNVPIDQVILVCRLDVLDSLFLIANASRNYNCPLPLLTLCFFSPLALASSTPILTFFMTMPCFRLRWLFMEDVEPVAYLIKFALANFTHSNCFVNFCPLRKHVPVF